MKGSIKVAVSFLGPPTFLGLLDTTFDKVTEETEEYSEAVYSGDPYR